MPACKICKRIIPGSICPNCKEKAVTDFKGIIIVYDKNCELAKKLNIQEPGEYALKVG
jgi:RNA polymerase subunit RPABC4/transcription elongation factor Spt4